jgi:hypothetical protein
MMNNLQSIWTPFSFPRMENKPHVKTFWFVHIKQGVLQAIRYENYCVWAMQHHYHKPLVTKYLCVQTFNVTG